MTINPLARAPIGALCRYCGCPCGGEVVTVERQAGGKEVYAHLTATACLEARQRAERVRFNRAHDGR
jgi:hypothetical protein